MRVFLVGGAVRDQLLNLPVKERDWAVVGATPEMMLEQGFIAVGKDFPVFLHPRTKEEYALARTERKVGSGYHGFSFHTDSGVSLEEDLRRRDLTINAMAYDEEQNLIDPCGGMRDLKQKVLRHVSPAFAEDPVRVLRLARFAARFQRLGFVIADETMELMRTMSANGEVSFLVPERVWRELESALAEPTPSVFFEVLWNAGALPIVIPEAAALFRDSELSRRAMAALNLVREDCDDRYVIFSVLANWCSACGKKQDAVGDALCDRLKVSKVYRRFVRGIECLSAVLADAPITAAVLLVFFERSGILRDSGIFPALMTAAQFLKVSMDMEAQSKDAKFQLLSSAHAVLVSLDLKSIAVKCESPQEIEQAVRETRLSTLADLIVTFNTT